MAPAAVVGATVADSLAPTDPIPIPPPPPPAATPAPIGGTKAPVQRPLKATPQKKSASDEILDIKI